MLEDRRKGASRRVANRLSEGERRRIVSVCNEQRFQSLPPSQIVPALADEGCYLASESTFYRVLREAGQINRRGRAKSLKRAARPQDFKATESNQVWSWDITYLGAAIVGLFFRLYMVMDIFSRKIVAWEVHESETSEHAAVLAEGIAGKPLVLHSNNGSPMKGATMLATLERLGARLVACRRGMAKSAQKRLETQGRLTLKESTSLLTNTAHSLSQSNLSR